MKKIFSFLVLLTAMTMVTSCSNNDATYTAPEILPITVADVLFGAGGGDGSIVANTTSSLIATTNASWLTLTTNGNTVTVTSQANTSLEARSAKIIVSAADGATASVVATQHGLLLALDAENSYLFKSTDNAPTIILDKSNVEFEQVISADWIHLDKVVEGYSITVDSNEGEYRHGTIELSFAAAEFKKVINIGQWGESFPFASLNTATYEDENGNSYTKDIQIVEGNDNGTWLIKGLMDEGDILFSKGIGDEFYVGAGYSPGTRTEGSTTYTLRCLLSAYNVNTGNRFYPTQISTQANNAYRMAFEWLTDEDANPSFDYVRNSTLSPNYRTDGIIVCKFNSPSSASSSARKGIVYEFLNLKFSSK